MDVGHWKLVYPRGTLKGVKRASWRATAYLIMDGQEIRIPGVTAFNLATSVGDADKVTVEAIGTVEVSYDGASEDERDDDVRALLDALKDVGNTDE